MTRRTGRRRTHGAVEGGEIPSAVQRIDFMSAEPPIQRIPDLDPERNPKALCNPYSHSNHGLALKNNPKRGNVLFFAVGNGLTH